METPDLEQRLRDRPGDRASWLVYGDRLLDRGDARGTLIRLEERRARCGPVEGVALDHEITGLEREHQVGWDAALPEGVTVLARRYGFATKIAVEWSENAPAVIERALRDPFVTALRIRPPAGPSDDDEEEEEEEWIELDEDGMPLGAPPVEAGALATLDLGRLTELDLSYFRVGDPGARALAASIAKGRVETLDLRYCGIGDDGLEVLAASPHFDRLRRLRLQSNGLTAAGVRSLGRFGRLVDLDLRYNRIGADGADALLAAPFIGSLQRLLLHRGDLSDAGVKKLALADQLPPALRSFWRSV
ncbi:hypothetical protein [Actinomadura rugatobispora]|uniref:Leucine-rich repeat domain-containing protein n=1 Tax=Actinomadura rugatobispora TaxID=1994 RepID=A0ABW0ZX62_9ACTN|nr:hypothetical protein GCM10010200_090770 [Actinomadura rugatobispora]